MFDSEEQSFQKHVILLLIGELIGALWLIGLHQIAELILSESFLVSREPLHDLDQRSAEAGLCLFIVFGVRWTLEEVDHKVSCSFNGNFPICLEMEEECTENLKFIRKSLLTSLFVTPLWRRGLRFLSFGAFCTTGGVAPVLADCWPVAAFLSILAVILKIIIN